MEAFFPRNALCQFNDIYLFHQCQFRGLPRESFLPVLFRLHFGDADDFGNTSTKAADYRTQNWSWLQKHPTRRLEWQGTGSSERSLPLKLHFHFLHHFVRIPDLESLGFRKMLKNRKGDFDENCIQSWRQCFFHSVNYLRKYDCSMRTMGRMPMMTTTTRNWKILL